MGVVFVGGLLPLPESRDPRPGRLDVPSVVLPRPVSESDSAQARVKEGKCSDG
jgi:hypothetical protein